MNNLATKLDTTPRADDFVQVSGTLSRKEGGVYVVLTSRGEVRAKRAATCLLEPHEGARVLLAASAATGAEAEAFILAILEMDAGRSTEIAVDGDLRLRAAHGKIAVVAQEGIELLTAGSTRVVSNQVEVKARSARLVAEGIEYAGTWVKGEVERVKVVAKSLEQLVERFSLRAKRSYRRVEEMDQLEAGSVHTRVESTLHTHAKNTAITADGLVKIDGKEIHVG